VDIALIKQMPNQVLATRRMTPPVVGKNNELRGRHVASIHIGSW
jgi:hypothetical protein